MAGNVVCVRSEVSIEAVAALFVDLGISGTPVVDAHGRAMGMVSKSDLVRAQVDGTNRATVADVMMPIAFSLPENATVSHAAALMAYENIHRPPVVTSNGTVIGVVSAMDVVRWLAMNDGYLVPSSSRRTHDLDEDEGAR
jgi:CBS domain-containing protein